MAIGLKNDGGVIVLMRPGYAKRAQDACDCEHQIGRRWNRKTQLKDYGTCSWKVNGGSGSIQHGEARSYCCELVRY